MNKSRQPSTEFPGTPQRGFRLRLAGLLAWGAVVVLLAACSRPPQPMPTPTPTPRPAAAPAVQETPPQDLPAPGATVGSTIPAPATTPAALDQPRVDEAPLTGQPNRIVIPAIDLDAPIVDVGWRVVERGEERYTEWETADNAAGRHINSARPGQQGNVVLSGHHNTKGEVFRRISDLELAIGDMIYLYDGQGQRHAYIVDEITDPPLQEVGASEEERLANARYIQPTNDARVTLVTCWPYWTNTHRIIVVGKLVQ